MRTLYRTLLTVSLLAPASLVAQAKSAPPAIDDAAIVGIFDIANTWDIATGSLAALAAPLSPGTSSIGPISARTAATSFAKTTVR